MSRPAEPVAQTLRALADTAIAVSHNRHRTGIVLCLCLKVRVLISELESSAEEISESKTMGQHINLWGGTSRNLCAFLSCVFS